MTTVLWKETTFPLCRAMEKRWKRITDYFYGTLLLEWLSSQVVSMLDSGAVGPGLKAQPRRCGVTVLGKLFTHIVPLFTNQQNW